MMRRPVFRDESGIALVSALLVLLLMTSLMVGFTAMATTDTRVRAISGSRTQAFYFAHAGLEKLTADLGDLIVLNPRPTAAQLQAIMNNPPVLPGGCAGATCVIWMEGDGDRGYRIDLPGGVDANGNPVAVRNNIEAGPYAGFVGQVIRYTMDVTARLPDGSEANLTKNFETVAIPVFQFGMFSDMDMSFFPGPSFTFGGRVHTNGNLFLAANPGPVSFPDPVTVGREVVRRFLANGVPVSPSFSGNIRVRTATNAFRQLAENEGSVIGNETSAVNEPTWTNLSTGVYNYNIRNYRTGAKTLQLPIVDDAGGQIIDMIRRPVVNENVTNPLLLGSRLFSQASLRILLSDTAADISGLPTVTNTQPVWLGDVVPPGYIIDAARPPFALSPGPGAPGNEGARTPFGTPLLGGFLKIEMQNQAGAWQDVTLEILNLGIAGGQFDTATSQCPDPSPNAVIRLQRVRDPIAACPHAPAVPVATDYWPNVLYDAREGLLRDGAVTTTPPNWGGIIHYIELDARNLKRWLEGAIGASGTNALNVNGYAVYFSDRRGNRNAAGVTTGEYGFEDIVNTPTGGVPNGGAPERGEDLNGNGVLDTYGQFPNDQLIPIMTAPYSADLRPWHAVNADGNNTNDQPDRLVARSNPAVFFRRALKVVNGSSGNLPMPGLTIAAENPVYVQGHWNASQNGGFDNNPSATAFFADAVTVLSRLWNDRNSFLNAHNLASRNGGLSYFRFAALSGKGLAFNNPAGTHLTFGTDGGTHNQLRYLEDWPGNTMRFQGSLATMFANRQAVGTFKWRTDNGGTVFREPTRGYSFDVNFLNFNLLPPRTPMITDMNTTGFAQIIRPR
jgi:hypothetical protein